MNADRFPAFHFSEIGGEIRKCNLFFNIVRIKEPAFSNKLMYVTKSLTLLIQLMDFNLVS